MKKKAKRTLRGIRSDLGLTQKEMAEKLGTSFISYQRYETYQNRMPSNILVGVADLAGIIDVREIKYE